MKLYTLALHIDESHLFYIYRSLQGNSQWTQWFDFHEPEKPDFRQSIIVWNPVSTLSHTVESDWSLHLKPLRLNGHAYCGWYGAVSYDWGKDYMFSKSKNQPEHDEVKYSKQGMNACPSPYWFGYYTNVMVYDASQNKASFFMYEEREYLKILDVTRDSRECVMRDLYLQKIDVNCAESFDDYAKKIRTIQQGITEGKYYQLNYTQEFTGSTDQDPLNLFVHLRKKHPVPYSAFLHLPDRVLLSMSPELMLFCNKDREVFSEPIKGTIAKTKDHVVNMHNQETLSESLKDKAELVMIVDLVRNDLGKVCKPSSIEVLSLYSIKAFNTVYHLTSLVKGVLDVDKTPVDAFLSIFPGGSITGAPKMAAMEHLGKLENHQRQYYTGSAGFFLDNQMSCLNIMIRTLDFPQNGGTFKNLKIYAGGGIVIDSDEKKEYEEVIQKLKFISEV